MTSHGSFPDWKIEDPIPEGLKEDISFAVNMNLHLMEKGCFSCFAVMSNSDQMIYTLGSQIDSWRSDPERLQKEFDFTADSCPSPGNFRAIANYVVNHLDPPSSSDPSSENQTQSAAP